MRAATHLKGVHSKFLVGSRGCHLIVFKGTTFFFETTKLFGRFFQNYTFRKGITNSYPPCIPIILVVFPKQASTQPPPQNGKSSSITHPLPSSSLPLSSTSTPRTPMQNHVPSRLWSHSKPFSLNILATEREICLPFSPFSLQ